MGRHHARVYAQLEGAELVGVVDRSEERRTAITDEWGGRPLSTVEELIDLGVDAVTIATPTIHHREAAEALLEAGVACLIEKPLAPTADEAMAIAETARRCETTLQVGHVQPFLFRGKRDFKQDTSRAYVLIEIVLRLYVVHTMVY